MFRRTLRQFAEDRPEWSDRDLAVAFVDDIDDDELETILTEEFGHVRREATREVESDKLEGIRNLASMSIRRPSHNDRSKALAELSPLLDASYSLGGVRKHGRDMTYDDWAERLAMLTAQRNGVNRSIEICENAMQIIKFNGVRTLGEL
jgi:hypothetical protein